MADARVKEIDEVLKRLMSLVEDKQTDSVVLYQLETLALAAIRRHAPVGTTYRAIAEDIAEKAQKMHPNDPQRGPRVTQPLRGVLRSLRFDYDKGFVQSVEELIHADVFSDFLEMSRYLLEQHYKDPAAVLVGGVLEEHLRKLAVKSGIPLESEKGRKKASTLNDDLARANVYGKLDHKNITGWLEIRNSAAHADWTKYNEGQVDLMLRGVQELAARLPA